jgi:hypothetical protein
MANKNQDLAILTQQDPLAYGIAHIDLLQGRLWQVDTRAWIKEIYASVNPWAIEREPFGKARQAILMKPTQVGITTTALVKMFHFADNWPVRIIYMLPRQQDYIDFVTTRIDPIISSSDRLSGLLGTPDSTRAKQIGDSYLFFMESTVEPRMMPADALMVDELDLSELTNVGTALNRLDDSHWQLKYYFSTPTLPNYGIHGRYLLSDMRKWLVKCPGCNEWQELDWEINLRVIGRLEKPTEVYLACHSCGKRFDLEIIQKGRWVPEKPSRSSESIGFHMSQMMMHPVEVLYKHWLDPEQTIIEFYRKRLGKPYELAGGSVTRDDFLVSCFDEPFTEEIAHDGKSKYFMGLDQGNELQILIAKLEPLSRRPKIVKIELIPFESDDPNAAGFKRVEKLMRLFKIRRLVADADPNRHSIRALQKKLPGRVIMADYINIKKRFRTAKEKGSIVDAGINRSESFDDLMESIRDGYWALPGLPPVLSPMVETLISHVTSLKRDIIEQRILGGVQKKVVWRKLRPDNLAHSMLYLKLAIEIDTGTHHKIVVIGAPKPEEDLIDEEDLTYWPKPDIIAQIVPRLAEVPQEQAQLYFQLKAQEKLDLEKLPMPLKYKLTVLDQFSEKDIEWVLEQIASFGKEPIPLHRNEKKQLQVLDEEKFHSKRNLTRIG